MAGLENWRPDTWETLNNSDLKSVFEAGADTMHLADVEYLEGHKILVNLAEKGKVKVTFEFTIEEWEVFIGKEYYD